MEVNQRIFYLLELQGKTASELAKYIGISNASVSAWKNEGSYPSSKYIERISEFLKTTPNYLLLGLDNLPPTLRGDEKRLLHLYNDLNISGRRKAMIYMFKASKKNKEDREWWELHQADAERLLQESFGSDWVDFPIVSSNSSGVALTADEINSFPDFEADDEPYPIMREVNIFSQPASAGKGTFLDSDEYETLEFPFDEVPLKTTFGVRISGDSMEPNYADESIVFVRQQPTIESGELGIFILNGDAYFKRFISKGKTAYLESINTQYQPIYIKSEDEMRIVGKVIGKYEV